MTSRFLEARENAGDQVVIVRSFISLVDTKALEQSQSKEKESNPGLLSTFSCKLLCSVVSFTSNLITRVATFNLG